MKGSRRHRRAIALMTCALWLLGVEVLPNLHLAFHHDDHTHAADGTIRGPQDEHEHGHHYDQVAPQHHGPT